MAKSHLNAFGKSTRITKELNELLMFISTFCGRMQKTHWHGSCETQHPCWTGRSYPCSETTEKGGSLCGRSPWQMQTVAEWKTETADHSTGTSLNIYVSWWNLGQKFGKQTLVLGSSIWDQKLELWFILSWFILHQLPRNLLLVDTCFHWCLLEMLPEFILVEFRCYCIWLKSQAKYVDLLRFYFTLLSEA